MGAAIDFTEWTDAQLEAGERFTASPNYPALKAELDRRRSAGVSDGSKERVAQMIAENPGMRGKRVRDGEAAQGARRRRTR